MVFQNKKKSMKVEANILEQLHIWKRKGYFNRMLHRENATLRVRLVGGVEKWENRKLWEDGKVGG